MREAPRRSANRNAPIDLPPAARVGIGLSIQEDEDLRRRTVVPSTLKLPGQWPSPLNVAAGKLRGSLSVHPRPSSD